MSALQATVKSKVEEKLQLILDLTLENRAMLKMLVTRRDQKNNVDEADERLAREIIQLLPLKSINALLEFEQKVKDNEQFALAVLQKLSIIGGSDFKNNTRRIMTALFTNDVGMLVSWTGQKDNLKIGDFTIMEIVRKAVKKGYTTATDREFELAVSEWLRYSRQRKGREKRIDGHLLQ